MTAGRFDSDENPSTYFGLYSDKQRIQLVELLSSLGIQFEFVLAHESDDILREWTAWDESSEKSHEGFHLFIRSADLKTLGTTLVDLFPERKFGAD